MLPQWYSEKTKRTSLSMENGTKIPENKDERPQMSFRVSEDEKAWIDGVAKSLKLNRATLVRLGIRALAKSEGLPTYQTETAQSEQPI